MSNEIKILNRKQIFQNVLRLSWEIYENNLDQKELLIVGVGEKGFLLAKEVSKNLSKISSISPLLRRLDINSKISSNKLTLLSEKDYKNKVIILVDDVINSGKTLMYACKTFLNTSVKKMSVVVLIDRNHNSYPIKADYVGLSLSTTLKEYIKVVLSGKNQGVYLS